MQINDSPAFPHSLLRPEVALLPSYDPGADPQEVRARFDLARVIKLSNNENPLGYAPGVAAVLARQEQAGACGNYPDPASLDLRDTLAQRLDVSRERIVIGNGSENILEMLCHAFVNRGDRVVTQLPCFGLHEIFPLLMGAHVHKVAGHANFGFYLPAWRHALSLPTKMLLISNPCNPTGVALSGQEFQALIEAAPADVLLVIDEAYFEYAHIDPAFPYALAQLTKQARPWIVLRTFSKAYGLAGLRVGYGIASAPWVAEALDRVRTPYNINRWAQHAAIAALDDMAHVGKGVAMVIRERRRLAQALQGEGFAVATSAANFLFIDVGANAVRVAAEMLRDGVIVKPWRQAGFESFIRVSIGMPEDNDALFHAVPTALQRLEWEDAADVPHQSLSLLQRRMP